MQQLKSGVYQIRNLINGKRYIGSAKNFINRRSNHWWNLFKNKHHSCVLQKSYNKYGKENFVFEILALCPPEYCIKLEQWFFDNLKPEYNILKIAGSCLGRKLLHDSPLKGISKSKEHISNLRFSQRKHSKSVCQFDLKGFFLQEWKNAKMVEDTLGYSTKNIYGCCKGKLKSAYGYIWKLKEDTTPVVPFTIKKYKSYTKSEQYKKKIMQFDLSGIFIKTWNNIKEVCAELHVRPSNMHYCIRHQDGKYKGYIWKFI